MTLGTILKLLATPLRKVKGARDASMIAIASVAETLLQACKITLAEDVGKLKKEFQNRLTAQTQQQQAEAQKKIAEAVNAANKVTEQAHEVELRRLERERLEIENLKARANVAEAEAKASEARSKATAVKIQNWKALAEIFDEQRDKRRVEAEDELNEALRQLSNEGGKAYFDKKNLKELIKPETDSEQQ